MMRIRKEKVEELLDIIGRNKKWLAGYLGINPAFLSQILGNHCKIPPLAVERLLLLGFRFEDLFEIDGLQDDRETYTGKFWHTSRI